MSTIVSQNSIFSIKESDYTSEQWERLKKVNDSERQAELKLTQIYDKKVASVILFNIMASYKNTYRKFADTYEQACEGLGSLVVNDIIFRAINNLPARGLERRKQEAIKHD